MARPLRIEYDGALYHLTSRGNERKAIFKDDTDRQLFLNTIVQVTERFHWICHAYCLMDNHYHLVIETPDGNLSQGMRHINGVYTQAFNRRHHRVGHLFQGRFKGILVQKESHFLEMCRYVVLNPSKSQSGQAPQRVGVEQLPGHCWTSLDSPRTHGGGDSEPFWTEARPGPGEVPGVCERRERRHYDLGKLGGTESVGVRRFRGRAERACQGHGGVKGDTQSAKTHRAREFEEAIQ